MMPLPRPAVTLGGCPWCGSAARAEDVGCCAERRGLGLAGCYVTPVGERLGQEPNRDAGDRGDHQAQVADLRAASPEALPE